MNFQCGDIVFTDSNKTGARIVKFLMTAPTCWHHLLWKISGRIHNERPSYYHVAMVLTKTDLIEQQRVVEIDTITSILKKKHNIFRNKYLTEEQMTKLSGTALADLGEGYGIAECFGKFLTWITGVRWFSKAFDMKDRAICIVRVAEWYRAIGYSFGAYNPNYLTTKSMLEHLCGNPNWEAVYWLQ